MATQARGSADKARGVSHQPVLKNKNLINGSGSGIGNVNADDRALAAGTGGGRQKRLPRALVAECSAPLGHVTSTEVCAGSKGRGDLGLGTG